MIKFYSQLRIKFRMKKISKTFFQFDLLLLQFDSRLIWTVNINEKWNTSTQISDGIAQLNLSRKFRCKNKNKNSLNFHANCIWNIIIRYNQIYLLKFLLKFFLSYAVFASSRTSRRQMYFLSAILQRILVNRKTAGDGKVTGVVIDFLLTG